MYVCLYVYVCMIQLLPRHTLTSLSALDASPTGTPSWGGKARRRRSSSSSNPTPASEGSNKFSLKAVLHMASYDGGNNEEFIILSTPCSHDHDQAADDSVLLFPFSFQLPFPPISPPLPLPLPHKSPYCVCSSGASHTTNHKSSPPSIPIKQNSCVCM